MWLRDAGFALMVALFPVAVVPVCIVAEWLAKLMGITSNDIAAQRAMIERGEEERLRDQFAAAALTGLIANGDYSVDATPLLAYRMADAMLRERLERLK